MSQGRFQTVREFADRLDVASATVRRWITSGSLCAIDVGKGWRIHASKGAVRLVSKNDAITCAAEQIRVNSVHPGSIWTPMVENHLRATSNDLQAARAAAGSVHPLGHKGGTRRYRPGGRLAGVRRYEVRHRNRDCHRRRLYGAMT